MNRECREKISDDAERHGRKLIYFPIIHTQADMGVLEESVKRSTLEKLGLAAFKHKLRVVDELWSEIERFLDKLELSYPSVRLYQDGLPVCGREDEIVKDLAQGESRNHKLLFRLMEQGATVMGTESPELLLQEYDLVKEALSAEGGGKSPEAEAARNRRSEELLKRRNRFIAERINDTLRPGETGVLFLGMLHSLGSMLDRDIRVTYPLNRPLEHGGPMG